VTADLPALPMLVDLATGSPVVVRLLVGAIGAVLLLWGARIYKPALMMTSFAAGSLGAVAVLIMATAVLPALASPAVLIVGALIGGLALAGLTALVHRLGLVAVGALAGVTAAGAVVEAVTGAVGPWWAVALGAVAGAVALPLAFKGLLKVVTPAVGAVCIAWAVGLPTHLLLLLGLWAFGAVVQLAIGSGRGDDEGGE